ncbi:AAA family ATPase [Cyanobium sp. LEGE 06113]|uniref:AAA family ATPase n=1 Tax=Cyanobium sp. LEGE 06113 TaxID=1297573 RepID=UPI00187F199D|nr:AAA family ATPase [Cyanobium sp. LEGE 06113]MBE9155185.1 hypothetical protein [Cyanobium sp. LEGE 06113]
MTAARTGAELLAAAGIDPATPPDGPDPFKAAWEAMEEKADELVEEGGTYLRQLAAMRWQASQQGLGLGARGAEQLLEAAQLRRRPAAEPPPMGGAFRVRARPWAVQGIFRHGLNLLVGASGGGKSRLASYIAAQWLYGSGSVLASPSTVPPSLIAVC